MRSRPAEPLGVQVPRVRHAPKVRGSAWEDVADVAKAYGLVLDEWQENVLQAAMGERADGQWATPRVGVSVPRQNGKGALIEARELAGLLVFGERVIVHSAHEQKTARVGFDRIRAYFDNYDDLRKRVRQVGSALSREYIELTSGQKLVFPARSKGAIRGFSIDCLILDEAQILGDTAWQAIQPTISARPNPQTWLLGTPPTPADDGAVFSRMRQGGLDGKDHRLCWCEWSVPTDSGLDDVEVWAVANPALGVRVNLDAIRDERASMDDVGFARERLGMWDEVQSRGVLPAPSWKAAEDERSIAVDRFALGVECGPDLAYASVALAGQRADGDWHLELDDDQHTRGAGTAWLVPHIEAMVAANPQVRAVVVDVAGPVAALLEKRPDGRWFFKGSKVEVTPITVADLGASCSLVLDGVVTGWLHHIGQPQLSAAALAAGKRALADTGKWVWSRKSSTSDITPIQACTLALAGAQRSTVKRPARGGGRRAAVIL
jgi:hypothetical protein